MPDTSAKPRFVVVSFSFPPLAYPRSIQVSRLLQHLDAEWTLFCGDYSEARIDPTILPDESFDNGTVIRLPQRIRLYHRILRKAAEMFSLDFLVRIPDFQLYWVNQSWPKIVKYLQQQQTYDACISFGMPMSCHLLGKRIAQRFSLPWIAHFSDPWAWNPYNTQRGIAHRINLCMEKTVLKKAHAVVVPSKEIQKAYCSLYPQDICGKIHTLNHSFDPERFTTRERSDTSELIIRYIGNFYGKRSILPLLRSLLRIEQNRPDFFNGIRFEIIGHVEPRTVDQSLLHSLPPNTLSFRKPVPYSESLDLMVNSDGLLLIDAPAQENIFFPSKLADYIGAQRPILGITPNGTSERILNEFGYFSADPEEEAEIDRAIYNFIKLLRKKNNNYFKLNPNYSLYSIRTVADSFSAIIQKTVSTTGPSSE